MTASQSNQRSKILAFTVVALVVGLVVYLYSTLFDTQMHEGLHKNFVRIPFVALLALLAYLGVRFVNAAIFDFAFRLRRGYEAPTLVRNIFTLISFTVLFVLIFKSLYSDVQLGAIFTTSAIFGVIIGLALQDTLGNFLACISLHYDRPCPVA